ncbi:MAG: hypothetical protein ACUVSQ_02380 [Pseudanabaenaceae cyanobacterium]
MWPILRPRLKENFFLLATLNWGALGLLLGGWGSSRAGFGLVAALPLGLGLSSTAFWLFDAESLLARACLLTALVSGLVVYDLGCGRFRYRAIAHGVNGVYLSFAVYFVALDQFPEAFLPVLEYWREIAVGAREAFDMLIGCFLFQNLGYYALWPLLTQFKIFRKPGWNLSPQNIFNVAFLKTAGDRTLFFYRLGSVGLLPRFLGLARGRVFYFDGGSGISFLDSLLAQFQSAYNAAWIFGVLLLIQPAFSTNGWGPSARRWLKAGVAFVLSTEFFVQLVGGSKGGFYLAVVVPLALAYLFGRQQVSWGVMGLLVSTGLVAVLVVYPTLTIYREQLFALLAEKSRVEAVWDAFQQMLTLPWTDYEAIVLRPFNQSGTTEQVVALTASVKFRETIAEDPQLLFQRLLLFWVPRIAWPGKPEALNLNRIGRLTQRVGPEDFGTAVLLTGPGELYLYFGLAGCGLMLLPGFLLRWLEEATSPFWAFSPFRIALFLTFFPRLALVLTSAFESSLSGLILQFLSLYVVLNLIGLLITELRSSPIARSP